MLREGDKVYHYRNINRNAIITRLFKKSSNLLTIGGTTEQRLMAEIKYIDNDEVVTVFAGDLFKQFD